MKRILLAVLSVAILPLIGRSADDISKDRKSRAAQDIPLMMAADPASED